MPLTQARIFQQDNHPRKENLLKGFKVSKQINIKVEQIYNNSPVGVIPRAAEYQDLGYNQLPLQPGKIVIFMRYYYI